MKLIGFTLDHFSGIAAPQRAVLLVSDTQQCILSAMGPAARQSLKQEFREQSWHFGGNRTTLESDVDRRTGERYR
jgi:hypothetical protein